MKAIPAMLGHLLIETMGQGMARDCGSPVDKSHLQGVDYSDVQGCVLTPCPTWNEDISRLGIGTWYQGSVFPGGTQASLCAGVEESIPHVVMSGNPLSFIATRYCMITFLVTLEGAGSALSRRGEDVTSQPVLNRDNELCWSEMESKGRRWYNIEPVSSMWQP